MRQRRVSLLSGLGFLLASVLVSGCGLGGPPMHVVKGKVAIKGQPMAVKPMVGKLRLWFLLEGATPPVDPKHAVIHDDGSFEVKGEGSGIAAGKYKICVIWQDDFPMGKDKLENKFDEKSSKIFRKVPEDGDITIDVSRPEG